MQSKFFLAGLIVILGTVLILDSQYDTKTELTSFENWMSQYNVKYDSVFERVYRERIFLENLAQIEFHNKGNHQYTMGVNQFTAMTQQQFVSTYLSGLIPIQTEVKIDNYINIPNQDIDWVDAGAVTPVQNQGQCGGASYAFSTVGALQGLSKIFYGKLQKFSEQQLVDCSGSFGNYGCSGGLITNSYQYVIQKGITTGGPGGVYPFKGVAGDCKIDGGNFKITGYTNITTCDDLTHWISQAVVSVIVDATNFKTYKSGVFNNCGTLINHAVTLVGVENGNWIIKNSWGFMWGENGYMEIKGGDTCGICRMGSVPF